MKRFLLLLIAIVILLVPVSAFADDAVHQDGFENSSSGLPDGWSGEAWVATDSDYSIIGCSGRTGQGVALYAFSDNDVRLCYTANVEKNSYYRISCYVKTQDVSGGAGANISLPNSFVTSEGVYGTSDWQYIELVGKTGKRQTELEFCVRVGGYSATSTGMAMFDDVELVKLDSEPAGVTVDFSDSITESSDGGDITEGKLPYAPFIILVPLITLIVFLLMQKKFYTASDVLPGGRKGVGVYALLALALIVRLVMAFTIMGHPTDIYCFMAWGDTLANNGLSTFYTSGMFADYTPGYMYVLYVTGWISKLLGYGYGTLGCSIITKLPSIIVDVAAVYLVYRLASRRLSERASLLTAGMVALSPVMAFISSGWGQVDQILAVLLLVCILLFIDKKLILAGLVYGLAVLVKPQALMVGPLLAVAYICNIIDEKKKLKALLKTVAAVVGALLLIWLLSLPFKGTQEPTWILERYFNTATSYPYATVEAYNLFAMFGGNWVNVDSEFFIFTYGQWGTALMFLSVVFTAVLYVFGRKREPHCLTLCAAYQLIALFMLGQYMHERYMFPALLLLLCAFIFYRDKRLLWTFSIFSATLMFNVLGAFLIAKTPSARFTTYGIIVRLGSYLNMAAFGYFTYVMCSIVFEKRIALPKAEPENTEMPQIAFREKYVPPKFIRKDRLFCWGLTLVYAVIALVNLGTTQAPETAWKADAGESAVIELDGEHVISDIRVFGGLYTGSVTVTLDDGTVLEYTEDNGDMFRWHSIGGVGTVTSGAVINVTSDSVWFNEIAFFDESGAHIPATSDALELVDEPEQVPAVDSYLNGMYFDELYHARTAYEHLNGLQPYENSHPPLGKVFIMLGIAIFGMNAFGWRIVGTLFGIGMVPLIYLFAKRLFKKSEYALLAAVLFAFDFMHFTQTRIATIDVYGVFFIILMFYFMYQYFCRSFYVDGLWATLKPLAICGVFFGLGAASKWICMYAGAGLAVLLFTSLGIRFKEYLKLRNSPDAVEREAVKPFIKYLVITLLWCVLFFIIIPAGIYLASYLPYYLAETPYNLSGVWDVQKFMWNYHSTLTATHPYQSTWWQWILDIRPMWYYVGYSVGDGNISTISAMGNPAVWWGSLLGTLALIGLLSFKKLKLDAGKYVILVGIAANLLPWVFVTRCTFIYHYFATVPFIIFSSVYVVRYLEMLSPRWNKLKWIWMGLTVGLFILFYPVISGLECSKAYVGLLEWLPTWTFMGY